MYSSQSVERFPKNDRPSTTLGNDNINYSPDGNGGGSEKGERERGKNFKPLVRCTDTCVSCLISDLSCILCSIISCHGND